MKEEKVQINPQSSNEEIINLYKENVDLRKEVEILRKENKSQYEEKETWQTKYQERKNQAEYLERRIDEIKEDFVVKSFFSVIGAFLVGIFCYWIFSTDPKYTIRDYDLRVVRIENTNMSGMAEYYINKGDSVCFRDSVGKFNIGDVIKLSK